MTLAAPQRASMKTPRLPIRIGTAHVTRERLPPWSYASTDQFRPASVRVLFCHWPVQQAGRPRIPDTFAQFPNEKGRPEDDSGRPWCETDLKMGCALHEYWFLPIRKNFCTPFCTPTASCAAVSAQVRLSYSWKVLSRPADAANQSSQLSSSRNAAGRAPAGTRLPYPASAIGSCPCKGERRCQPSAVPSDQGLTGIALFSCLLKND